MIAVANQLGYGVDSVRNWVHQAEADAEERPGTTTVDAERIKRLEQANRELRRADEIMKRASALCAGGARPATEVMVRFIEEHWDKSCVEPICSASYRKSIQSWAEVLVDLKDRGMTAPAVAMGDGALRLHR